MSDIADHPDEETEGETEIALEYELDAKPEKIWRAIALPAFRERWLPEADLAEPEPVASIPGVEVRYRMREEGAAFPDSTVTFRIEPGPRGGALLRIIHRIEGDAGRDAANDNLRLMSLKSGAVWQSHFPGLLPPCGGGFRRGVAPRPLQKTSHEATISTVGATPHPCPPPQGGRVCRAPYDSASRRHALAA